VIETGEFEPVGSSARGAPMCGSSPRRTPISGRRFAAGRFRQDLLFRLNTVEISLPPLRDRPQDITELAAYFLEIHALRHRKKVDGLDPAALAALRAYPWPGNVRELEHVLERAVLMSEGGQIRVSDLGFSTERDTEPTSRRKWSWRNGSPADPEGHSRATREASAKPPTPSVSRAARSTAGSSVTECETLPMKKPRRSHENRIFWIALASGLPGIAAAILLLWRARANGLLFWTVLPLLAVSAGAFAFALRNRVVRTLQTAGKSHRCHSRK